MRVTDAVGCFGAASVFILGSALIPFLGSLLGLLTPLPFLYYCSKLGIREGLKVSGVSLLLLSLLLYLTGQLQIIFLAVEFSFLGVVLSELYRREVTIGYVVLWGSVSALLVGFVALSILGWSRDMGPHEVIQAYIQESLKEAAATYLHLGMEEAKTAEFQQYMKILAEVILKVYPGVFAIGTGFAVWSNIMISRPLFRATGLSLPSFGPLERWQAPEHMVWGVIASGFALFLTPGVIQSLAINALIVMLAVYLFQGLSILLFFFAKYRIPTWARFGIYFLIVFQQVFLLTLAMAGLFDQWIDFRKMHAPKATQ